MNAQNDNSEINPRGPGAMVTQNWNSLPTINIKDGSYYHNIGADLTSYGSNLSTYW